MREKVSGRQWLQQSADDNCESKPQSSNSMRGDSETQTMTENCKTMQANLKREEVWQKLNSKNLEMTSKEHEGCQQHLENEQVLFKIAASKTVS